MVIRMPAGGGAQRGAQHSQFFESLYAHIPGLKVVMPATPYDAKGMLKSAIRDDDPVLFIEHELLYSVKGEVPDEGEEYTVPLNRGDRSSARARDVTLVTFSRMVHICQQAAEELAKDGIEAEVLDLRSIRPIDLDLILDSVRKTNRVVVAEEGWKYYGTGQGIAALIYEHAFDYLDAPIGHVTGKDVPMPYAKPLEQAALPTHADVIAAVKAIVPARSGRRRRVGKGSEEPCRRWSCPRWATRWKRARSSPGASRRAITVAKGDALAEIETEKVNIEAEAFAAGVLRKILVQEGESAGGRRAHRADRRARRSRCQTILRKAAVGPAHPGSRRIAASQREPVPAAVGAA